MISVIVKDKFLFALMATDTLTWIDRTTEHSTTLSVYFFDPDGNRLEIFAEKLSPEEGRRVLREGGGMNCASGRMSRHTGRVASGAAHSAATP